MAGNSSPKRGKASHAFMAAGWPGDVEGTSASGRPSATAKRLSTQPQLCWESPPKAGNYGRIAESLGRQDLDGNRPVKFRVPGPIDDAHAARSEFLLHLVTPCQNTLLAPSGQ